MMKEVAGSAVRGTACGSLRNIFPSGKVEA